MEWTSKSNRRLELLTHQYLQIPLTFSDYLWNPDDSDFPNSSQLINYLNGYIEKHGLLQYFHFNSTVVEVARHSEDYIVRWKSGEQIHEKMFKFVILATGQCSKEISPLKNPQEFSGIIVKGGEYREPSVFTGKKVVCIGRSYTSSDIAFEALSTADQVTQIYKKPTLIIKKYVTGVPYDFYFFPSSSIGSPPDLIHTLESNHKAVKELCSLFGNPSEILPDWEIPHKSAQFFRNTIHNDNYLEAVSSRRISLVKGLAKEFYGQGVVLADGRQVEADVVVIGTGYITDFSYLSGELKEILQYKEDDALRSAIMYRSMIHPALPRLCFVGNSLTGYPGRFELAAEIGIRYLFGELGVSEEELWQGVRDEEVIRETLRSYGVAYPLFDIMKEAVRILGIRIDREFVRKELEFDKGPMLPQMFWLERPGQIELAKMAIAEIKGKFPHFQFNSGVDPNIK